MVNVGKHIPYMDGVLAWPKTRTEEKNGSRFVSFSFCLEWFGVLNGSYTTISVSRGKNGI